MAILTKQQLDDLWITGYVPTQQDYRDVWETFFNGLLSQPKIYKVQLSQSGTDAPTAQILQNTLSSAPVWTRTGSGAYTITLPGEFTLGKTYVSISQSDQNTGIKAYYQNDADSIDIYTYNTFWANIDDALSGGNTTTSLLIEVYP